MKKWSVELSWKTMRPSDIKTGGVVLGGVQGGRRVSHGEEVLSSVHVHPEGPESLYRLPHLNEEGKAGNLGGKGRTTMEIGDES